MKLRPENLCDFYKTGHIRMFPEGTEEIYSNFTCRSDKHFKKGADWDGKVVMAGLQGAILWLNELWNKEFFDKPIEEISRRYSHRMNTSLGGTMDVSHIIALHKLGYLPIEIKAIPEGERVDIRVPLFTIRNTKKEFYWLTNYLETQLSAELWKTVTSATTAWQYRKLFERYAETTGSPKEFVLWQGHDFSMRGMSGVHDATQSGVGHLLSFTGTDTISSIDYIEEYYCDPTKSLPFIGGSVAATEHAGMCAGGPVDELDTYRRLITDLYPNGIISIVSDTYDFWGVVGAGQESFVRSLKDDILRRDGKVVFRPDSGDPVKILCGDPSAPLGSDEHRGAVECLWEVFGGTETPKGYKVLDSHVGLIYGDSITYDRANEILAKLWAKGFASCNVVFGIGSYTYQDVTRDTLGCAIKATSAVVKGVRRELFKDPKTDDGTKKSAKGLIRVEKETGRNGREKFVLYDQQTEEQEKQGWLEPVFKDGALLRFQTVEEIRGILWPK